MDGPSDAGGAPSPFPPMTIDFIDDLNIPSGGTFGDHELGGLSALVYRERDDKLIALSDAHLGRGPSRFYELALSLDKTLEVTPTRVIDLEARGGPFATGKLDPEGIALLPGGDLLVANEGAGATLPRIAPSIHRVRATDGQHLRALEVPAKFLPNPEGALVRGVRHNKGFEGLAAAASGRWVYAMNEQALVQDGDEASFEEGTRLRLVRYDRDLKPVAEYLYVTEPIPPPGEGRVTMAENGVSALVALDDDRILVLERAVVAVNGVFRNYVRIFETSTIGGQNVAEADALSADARPLDKTLRFDLDDLLPVLELGFQTLDNFEGMTLGPPTADGEATLVLVSDNNFSPRQRTMFVALVIR